MQMTMEGKIGRLEPRRFAEHGEERPRVVACVCCIASPQIEATFHTLLQTSFVKTLRYVYIELSPRCVVHDPVVSDVDVG